MDSDRIKLWFQSGGASISECFETYVYYSNCALRIELITEKHLSVLSIFAIMQIISINELTFSDGFIINHVDKLGYDLTFEEISVILYAVSENIFESSDDLLRSYRVHKLDGEEYLTERSKVISAFLEANVKFLFETG
jgi:hypothetical protein